MQSICALFLASLALVCASEDAAKACASDSVADGGDDQCQLLQGGVGVLKVDGHHEGDHAQLAKGQHQAHAKTDATDEGFPDILGKIAGALGGAGKLEKDFHDLQKAVGTFETEVKAHVKELTASVKAQMTIDAVRAQVEAFYGKVHASALKLWKVMNKAISDFNAGIGKVAPAQFKSAVQHMLGAVSGESKKFADSFTSAANELKKVNQTMVCNTVKSGLTAVHKKVDELAKSALGMSTKGLSKEILAAKNALPGAIKTEVDKFLHKADEAAKSLKNSVSPTVKEIANGISKAFHGHCKDLQSGAGRLQVSLLSALLLGMSGFFM